MKKQIPYKMTLPESELPKAWYNVMADMKELPPGYLRPQDGKPAGMDDMAPLFARGLLEQEFSTERFIDIPAEVLEKYRLIRPSTLHRAYNLEKALGTPAHIYYKYEGSNPSGSHKLNSAIPQAFYNKAEGVNRLTTETGAGQWGVALSIATSFYDMECIVYMVKVSARQKPYRKTMMETYGATVIPSPSGTTAAGRAILAKDPDCPGSLGMAISEAVEDAVTHPGSHYTLGSVLNHVIIHQSIIGLEAKRMLEHIDEYPDVVIGCNGGGSNFSGIAFPFMMDRLQKGTKTRFVAVEATACPKLTKGRYTYDYGDTSKMAPITMMYTLGHDFIPPGIHAGGLRYHGDSPILSKLYHDGYIEASAIKQSEVFEAAMLFARQEALLPAPESSHAIAQAIREAKACRESGESKVILFNLSGNGYLDLAAYEQYISGNLKDDNGEVDAAIGKSFETLPNL